MNRLADRDEPVPPPARRQPGRLVPVGRRGVRARPRRGQAGAALGRVLVVPLVPRDGARVVRGPGRRRDDERPVREREGRPRGTTRRRRDLHAGRAGDDRRRRVADDRVPRPRRPPVLRRHVLAQGRSPGHARASRASWRRSTRRGANGATTSSSRPSSCAPRSPRPRRSAPAAPTTCASRPRDPHHARSTGCAASSTSASAASAAPPSSRRR